MDRNSGFLVVAAKRLDAHRHDSYEAEAAIDHHDDDDGYPNESNDDDEVPAVASDVVVDVTVILNPIFPDRIR